MPPLDRVIATGAPPRDGFRALDVVFEPARAFAALARTPRVVAPVAWLAAGSMALAFACLSRLDLAWFRADLIAHHPALADTLRGGGPPLTRAMLLVPAVVSAGVNAIAGWLALSCYALFVARALRRALTPVQALAFGAWSGVPGLAQLLACALNLALHADGRLMPDQLDPTTWEDLLGAPSTAFLESLARQVGLADAWTWALRVVGLRAMLGLRRAQAVALVGAPVLVLLVARATLAALGA